MPMNRARYKTLLKHFEGGGDVERDPLDVGGEVPTTAADQAKFLEFIINTGLDMAPATGEYRSAQSALDEYKKGNLRMAAVDTLGAVPLLGMMARGGRKLLPSIVELGDDVVNYITKLYDRSDDIQKMLPKSVPNERGLMTDPMAEFAKANPEKHAELVDLKDRIAKMNTTSMTDKTVEGTLRAGGFKPMSMSRQEIGMGLEQMSNDDIALVGGMRSGPSKGDETRLKYTVYDTAAINKNNDIANANNYILGDVELFVEDGTGKVRGLVELNIKDKKKGAGRKVIDSLMQSDFVDDLNVHTIKKSAQGFWDKMGVEKINDELSVIRKTPVVKKADGGEVLSNADWIAKFANEVDAPAPTNAEWVANYLASLPAGREPQGLSSEEMMYMFPPPAAKAEQPAPRTTDQFVGEYLKGTAMLPMPDTFEGEYLKGTTTLPMPEKPVEEPVSRAKEAMDMLVPEKKEEFVLPQPVTTPVAAVPKEGQILGNLLDSFSGDTKLKTEADYAPEIVDVYREMAKNALRTKSTKKGQQGIGIDYDDFPSTQKGVRPEELVGNSAAREKEGEGMKEMIIDNPLTRKIAGLWNVKNIAESDDPIVQAAYSIGGGTLFNEDGTIYLYDEYDFTNIAADKISDAYGIGRGLAGLLDKAGLINRYPSLIRLGTAEELFGDEANAILKKSGIKGIPDAKKKYMQSFQTRP